MEHTNTVGEEQQTQTPRAPRSPRRLLYFILGGVFVVLVGLVASAPALYELYYEGRMYPGVSVGVYAVGGLTRAEVEAQIRAQDVALANNGFTFLVRDGAGSVRSFTSLPMVFGASTETSVPFADIDADATVTRAYAVGRSGSFWNRLRVVWNSSTKGVRVPVVATVHPEVLLDVLHANAQSYETPMRNATVAFGIDGAAYAIPEVAGEEFAYEYAVAEVARQVSQLQFRQIDIPRVEKSPVITMADATQMVERAADVARGAVATLTFSGESSSTTSKVQSWPITEADNRGWLEVQKRPAGEVTLGISRSAFEDRIGQIATGIEMEPKDARFAIDETTKRVTQFQPAVVGRTIDRDSMYLVLNERMRDIAAGNAQATTTITLVVVQQQPTIRTADTNQLGIQDLLGVGVSKFVHSSPDRIKNIQNASDKLHGLLIGPGEEFSLVAALRPITLANGYVPEFVIKGDKIEKDIGGGLCQIGSTAFRAAMNSGLNISERYNHSLVVSYYNDLTNGNPGTDATIFDPSRDLKFINDTGHSLLLTTEVDVPNVTLKYYLWGTSDGRKAYYTPPTVLKWINPGETRSVKTTDLAPGKTHCQISYRGAQTTFDYFIERPDGKVDQRAFPSTYRPLPRICFVGVTPDELKAAQASGTVSQPYSALTPVSTSTPVAPAPTPVQ